MRKVIFEAKHANFERILWLEDDTLFVKNFTDEFGELWKKIPHDWSVVYLGATFKTNVLIRVKNYLCN